MAKDKELEKLVNIIDFINDNLSQIGTIFDDASKSISDFMKSMAKAKKDLKSIKVSKIELEGGEAAAAVEEPSIAAKAGAAANVTARDKAASLLFNMLSTKPGEAGAPPVAAAGGAPPMAGPPKMGPPVAAAGGAPPQGPPMGPPKMGPPSAGGAPPQGPPMGPPKMGPPSAGGAPPPQGGAPAAPKGPGGLPPPPKLPPAPGQAGGAAPGAPGGGVVSAPSFMKGPSAPAQPPVGGGISAPPIKPPAPILPPGGAPSGGAGLPPPPGIAKPAAPAGVGAAGAAGAAGGASLGSLRDEMLKELDRLKKIMRGT